LLLLRASEVRGHHLFGLDVVVDRIDLVCPRDKGAPERSLPIEVSSLLLRTICVLFASQVVILIPFVDWFSLSASQAGVAQLHRYEVVSEYLPQLLLIALLE